MNRIKQLSPQEAQKIAAGEVVERPANIVKELIENALDAGATMITCHIQDAGKSLIRIIDNGCGMSETDAQLCFMHHATSKITRIDDLQTINTFGFRGEALSSISAVSKVTLITKEADALHATKLVWEHGAALSNEQISGNTGTDITIADLFYNVPARKKFLKTNETESRQIILLFQAFCLAYPAIHFKLFSQGTLIFNCPAIPDMQQRIAQLWDHTVAQQLLPFASTNDAISVQGMISDYTYTRYDRSSMFFFVNNRWVKNYTLIKAVLKGYQNVLPPEKFPLICLAITIDPAHVDINVHPRKEEVQFLHPRIVESILQAGVKSALEKHLSEQLRKPVSLHQEKAGRFQIERVREHESPTRPSLGEGWRNTNSLPFALPDSAQGSYSKPVLSVAEGRTEQYPQQSVIPTFNPIQSIESDASSFNIIGHLYKTYILIEHDEHLMIIDQHAAHERVLYELFSTRFQEVATIQLLFPHIITLTQQDLQILQPHLALFTANNIDIELFGQQQLIIKAVPVYLKEIALDELVHQTIGWIKEHQKLDADLLYKQVNKKLHAQMACKAAVKAGDSLTRMQMEGLLTDLEKSPNRFTCPHGRPTGWIITRSEIEKKFKRKL